MGAVPMATVGKLGMRLRHDVFNRPCHGHRAGGRSDSGYFQGGVVTIDTINEAVERIRMASHDDEAAHSYEDQLHQAVLQEIADGATNAAEMARAALKTTEIKFCRWCA